MFSINVSLSNKLQKIAQQQAHLTKIDLHPTLLTNQMTNMPFISDRYATKVIKLFKPKRSQALDCKHYFITILQSTLKNNHSYFSSIAPSLSK
jgi:hypothetical protein